MTRLAAVLVLVLLTTACSGDDGPATEERSRHGGGEAPSRAALTWIGDVEEWFDEAAGYSTLRDCGASFAEAVAPPPSSGLEEVAAVIRDACTAFEEANTLEARGLAGEPDVLGAASAAFERAERRWADAVRLLAAFRPAYDRRLPTRGGTGDESRIHPGLGAVASRLLGQPAEIRCWSDRDWGRLSVVREAGAYVDADGGAAHFSARTCAQLVAFGRGQAAAHGEAELDDAWSLVVFAHELEHLRGDWTEHVTECVAVQDAVAVGVALGLSRPVAERLRARYWQELYPADDPTYGSSECRDGGRLDQYPGRHVFP